MSKRKSMRARLDDAVKTRNDVIQMNAALAGEVSKLKRDLDAANRTVASQSRAASFYKAQRDLLLEAHPE